jgi:hypothetical protein
VNGSRPFVDRWREELLRESCLSTSEKAVALALSVFFSAEGRSSNVGRAGLARACSCSENTVRKATRRLGNLGYLSTLVGGGGPANTYQALIPAKDSA